MVQKWGFYRIVEVIELAVALAISPSIDNLSPHQKVGFSDSPFLSLLASLPHRLSSFHPIPHSLSPLTFTYSTMTGKAKPKKHTAKEIQAKVDAATTNRGGGKAGLLDRTGLEKGGHAKYECPHCKVTAPDLKTMQIHHDSKHPKIPFDESKLNNLHATHVAESSKPKPGIRGSLKK